MRVAVAIGALAICAWFALGIVQAHGVNRAKAILNRPGHLNAAAERDAAAALASAGTLNPDREVDLLRAQLAAARGDRARAVQIIERVARAEPDNTAAWFALASTAHDAATSNAALRRIAQLVPPVPPR